MPKTSLIKFNVVSLCNHHQTNHWLNKALWVLILLMCSLFLLLSEGHTFENMASLRHTFTFGIQFWGFPTVTWCMCVSHVPLSVKFQAASRNQTCDISAAKPCTHVELISSLLSAGGRSHCQDLWKSFGVWSCFWIWGCGCFFFHSCFLVWFSWNPRLLLYLTDDNSGS